MKRTSTHLLAWILALTILSGSTGCSEKKPIDQPAATTLEETIKKFNEAYLKCDYYTLDDMLTVAYQHTNGAAAPMNRKDWLRFMHLRKDEITRGNLTPESYKMTGITTDYYEHVAVVTGTIENVETNRGNKETGTYRTTQVWVREGPNWKRAAYQDCRVH